MEAAGGEPDYIGAVVHTEVVALVVQAGQALGEYRRTKPPDYLGWGIGSLESSFKFSIVVKSDAIDTISTIISWDFLFVNRPDLCNMIAFSIRSLTSSNTTGLKDL